MRSLFEERSLRWECSGQKLAATVHLPCSPKEKRPAVLFCHGFTGNRIEQRYIFVRASRILALDQIGSLRFDYRGCGESEGLFKDFTLLDYIEDAETALAQLKTLPGVDADRLGILGYSLGGCVAAELLRRHPEIRASVLWSPVAFPGDLFFEQSKELQQTEISKDKGFIEYDGWAIGVDFIRFLEKIEPVESLADYPGPTLLCHGAQDTVVDPSHSRAYAAARTRPDQITEMLVLPESNHGYKPLSEDETLLNKTTAWFCKYISHEKE
jgi:hypothetical protein